MMSKIFPILLPLLFLSGCIRFFPSSHQITTAPPEISIEPVSDVVLRYATELKYDHELELEDSQIFYDDSLRRVRLQFYTQKIIELCDARFLIVEIVEELLARLNASGAARDQMLKRHFDPYDLDIYIHFGSFFVTYVDPAYISWVNLREGITTFYSGDLFLMRLDTWHARSEAYYKSRLFATIMKDAKENYKHTHPVPTDERRYFGRAYDAPVDILSR